MQNLQDYKNMFLVVLIAWILTFVVFALIGR